MSEMNNIEATRNSLVKIQEINNIFFEKSGKSIFAYLTIDYGAEPYHISYDKNKILPDEIKKQIEELFHVL